MKDLQKENYLITKPIIKGNRDSSKIRPPFLDKLFIKEFDNIIKSRFVHPEESDKALEDLTDNAAQLLINSNYLTEKWSYVPVISAFRQQKRLI